MKVRIIKNNPPDSNCSDITPIIGREFDAEEFSKGVIIKSDEGRYDSLSIYEGEYEVVEEVENEQ